MKELMRPLSWSEINVNKLKVGKIWHGYKAEKIMPNPCLVYLVDGKKMVRKYLGGIGGNAKNMVWQLR